MIYNFLAPDSLPEGGKYIGIGEALIDALIGFSVVFLGIALLVIIISIVGKIMTKLQLKKDTTPSKIQDNIGINNVNQDLDEETLVAITAAITAFYIKENRNCDFTVKRIKKL